MAMFQVHPHFGYLNTDICLINCSDWPIILKDKTDDKNYSIPAKSNITVKLKAGEHSFCAAGINNIIETIIVEDAIKLGGSREKKSYIFEDTPWAMMVMLDRTYFYNRETKEQYIEHGLAPKEIKFINNNYLLFISDTDNSMFSLDNLAVVETIGDSSFLFSNSQYAVFSIPTGILLYPIAETDDRQSVIIDCDDYAIDGFRNTLYYHNSGKNEVTIINLDSVCRDESRYKLTQIFQCFIGSHSVVTGYTPQNLYLINLISKKRIFLKEEIPVTSINGKQIWENNALTSITDNDIKNTFTSYVELSIHEKGERWFYIERCVNVSKFDGSVSKNEKEKYTLYIAGEITEGRNVPHLCSEKPLEVIPGKTFDGIKCNTGEVVLISEKECKDFHGEPIVSPNGYMVIAQKDHTLLDPRDSSCISTIGDEAKDTFRNTGLIKIKSSFELDDIKTLYQYRDIENNRVFGNTAYEDIGKEGFFRLFGGFGDFIHSTKGPVKPMPCDKDRLIAISEECNFAIIRNEDGIVINEYISAENKWSSLPLGNMEIDDSFFCKAVFCSDGENIIYQNQKNEYVLREIVSGKESEFQLQGSIIKRNINGYIPYLKLESHRKPVYVDPVTLTRVNDEAAEQFDFQSIDGSIKHIMHNIPKYYSNEKGEYVSEQEYQHYKEMYEYHDDPKTGRKEINGAHYVYIKNNRIRYYNENKEWIDLINHDYQSSNILGLSNLNKFINEESVCDGIIFNHEAFFIREKLNGKENIDIPLPQKLNFLNYVSYSFDNRYIIISGRFPLNSMNKGLAMVYDIEERKIVYQSTSTKAVWLGVFSKNGMLAYYDSAPTSFLSNNVANKDSYIETKGRSFLTFSPSGKFIALSKQGYIPYVSGDPDWGHQPCSDVYIARTDDPKKELAHYRDHGCEIEGLSKNGINDRDNLSVASATFSIDDKKLMTVSKDGVIVIRNLHLK